MHIMQVCYTDIALPSFSDHKELVTLGLEVEAFPDLLSVQVEI